MSAEFRAPTLADLEGLTELINRDANELYGESEETTESMKLWLTGPGLDPATDSRIAVRGGEVRGYVDIDADPDPTYWVDLRVPLSEDADIRTALVGWAEEEAAARGAGKPDGSVRFFTPSLDGPT